MSSANDRSRVVNLGMRMAGLGRSAMRSSTSALTGTGTYDFWAPESGQWYGPVRSISVTGLILAKVRIGVAFRLRRFVLKSRWATASRSHRSPEQLSAGASAVLFGQSQQSFLCKPVTLHWRCRWKSAWNRNFPCLNACVLMVFRLRSATCGQLSSIILWMRGRGRGSTSCQDVEVSPCFPSGFIGEVVRRDHDVLQRAIGWCHAFWAEVRKWAFITDAAASAVDHSFQVDGRRVQVRDCAQ